MIHPLPLSLSAFALLCCIPPAATAQTLPPTETPGAGLPGLGIVEAPSFLLVEHQTGVPALALPANRQPSTVQRAPAPTRPHGLAGARVRVLAFIRAAEIRHALPGGLLEALVEVESAFRPDAVSRAGAMGLAQLMPATARALGVLNPFDARANVDGGARFLRAMLDRFGSVSLALAAYNAGPGAVVRSRGVPANSETPAYVRKVLSAWSFGGLR